MLFYEFTIMHRQEKRGVKITEIITWRTWFDTLQCSLSLSKLEMNLPMVFDGSDVPYKGLYYSLCNTCDN